VHSSKQKQKQKHVWGDCFEYIGLIDSFFFIFLVDNLTSLCWHFPEGKPKKPPVKHVFKRRGKQQQVTETEDIDVYGSFSDMGLHENLLKGIYIYIYYISL
jgi:hypothetical protein